MFYGRFFVVVVVVFYSRSLKKKKIWYNWGKQKSASIPHGKI